MVIEFKCIVSFPSGHDRKGELSWDIRFNKINHIGMSKLCRSVQTSAYFNKVIKQQEASTSLYKKKYF